MSGTEIKKIMERESAKALIDKFKLKICGVDLEKLCSDEELIESAKQNSINEKYARTLENAVMCGLVYWDETKNCLCQKLIHPLHSGDMEADVLYYENQLNLNKTKSERANTTIEMLIAVVSLITGRPKPLIGTLTGQDVDIATACAAFFDL